MVERFVAGESLAESLPIAESLAREGFLVSLDYLGENTSSFEEAVAAKEMYIAMLRDIARSPFGGQINISIKLTQCGLDQGEEFAEGNFREVLAVARDVGNFVRVDMEGSAYTQRTIDMILRVWPEFQNTGTVLQSYLYRTPEDVALMNQHGIRTRLVKGAYLEPATIAFPSKADTDRAYVEQAKTLMEFGNYPAIATHDERIIEALIEFARERGIDKSRYEFQMLYGIRRDLQHRLLEQGYNVRIYIPYGDSWYPYFTRRLAERPANGLFIVKALFRG